MSGDKPASRGLTSYGGELLGVSSGLEGNGVYGSGHVPDGATATNATCSDEFVDLGGFGFCCCCRCLLQDQGGLLLSSLPLQPVLEFEFNLFTA